MRIVDRRETELDRLLGNKRNRLLRIAYEMIGMKKGRKRLKEGSPSLVRITKTTKCARRIAKIAIRASQPKNANSKT
jgi:hypothetical protein